MTGTVKENTKEILTNYGLDFTILKLPLVGLKPSLVVDSNGGLVESVSQVKSPYYGLYNSESGEIINTVKEGYTVSQNEEIVELVLEGIAPFGNSLKVVKAGSINGGRRVFMQLEIEGNSNVDGDPIKRYVTVIDSNDGSTSLSVGIGTLTVSCMNQFFKFYKEGDSKFRHTTSLKTRIQEIPFLVELALEQSFSIVADYNRWNGISVEEAQIHEMVKRINGKSRLTDNSGTTVSSLNHMETIYSHINKEMTQKGNNVWGLYSGITSFTTHEKTKENRPNQNMERLLGGAKYTTNLNANKFALELELSN